jgi:hypothetical protein
MRHLAAQNDLDRLIAAHRAGYDVQSAHALLQVQHEIIGGTSSPARLDLDQATPPRCNSKTAQSARGIAPMDTVRWIISTAPEIFLLLATAISTLLGQIRIRGFAIGATACILIVAVLIGQLGTFTFPSVLRVILFSLFVFTIGERFGPEFFAYAGTDRHGARARLYRARRRSGICVHLQPRSRHCVRQRRRVH